MQEENNWQTPDVDELPFTGDTDGDDLFDEFDFDLWEDLDWEAF